MKPETISYYGDNTHFICDKCNDSMTNTTANTSTTTSPSIISPYRITNGGIKIKSPDSSETDYRDFVHVPSKLNPTPTRDTSVVHAIRYFEKKQHPSTALQTHSPVKPPMQSNGYHSPSSAGKLTEEEKLDLRRSFFSVSLSFIVFQRRDSTEQRVMCPMSTG